MTRYYRGDTIEDAQSIIDTIVECRGGKTQTTPYETLFYFTNELYGYVVVVLDNERECLTETQINDLVIIPDGTYTK